MAVPTGEWVNIEYWMRPLLILETSCTMKCPFELRIIFQYQAEIHLAIGRTAKTPLNFEFDVPPGGLGCYIPY